MSIGNEMSIQNKLDWKMSIRNEMSIGGHLFKQHGVYLKPPQSFPASVVSNLTANFPVRIDKKKFV